VEARQLDAVLEQQPDVVSERGVGNDRLGARPGIDLAEVGSNQRERKNIDRFFWISRSTAGPRRRKRNNVQRTGRRNHLLHGRARCDEPSKRRTSASSSHKSRR